MKRNSRHSSQCSFMILILSSVREMHFLMPHTPLSDALHQSLECLSNRRMKHLAAIHQFCNSKCFGQLSRPASETTPELKSSPLSTNIYRAANYNGQMNA
ncbi:hypothetical protein CDAR_72841 [Caerostris darwini]|uniref:Uncharacterized protein n=1 Tax=Caerostris darwini TaxID=1538125 RepID=A0AAV4MKA8_9ARAC|nr:hypothetical protein CDAR_72841 [Caerostris darwini]